jgi:hypothetical protein
MELQLGGITYATSGKLDAFTQLHIARKLGPALPIVEGMVKPDNAGKDKSILTVLMLSHINDADVEYIIRKCLAVVTRQQDSKARAKITAPDGSLMFDDITMAQMLEISMVVVEENLGDFFRTALGALVQPGVRGLL